MSSANKAKGTRWENDLEQYFNESGVKARRLPRAGSKDIGDVAIEMINGHAIVIEAKNVKAADLADFLRQAEVEAANYEEKYSTLAYGIVAMKTRQKGAGDGKVVMTVDTLLNLLKWESLA
jgi:Holliday junction resolvase